MPCYDPRDGWDATHNSEAAGMLCEVVKIWIKSGVPVEQLPDDVRQWWKDHQDRDAYYERMSSVSK